MKYQIRILAEAELDLQEAYQWYESQINELGSELITMVDKSLALIQKNPSAYPIVYKNLRRKLLSRFPYGLFYLIDNNVILIFACFHVKRNP